MVVGRGRLECQRSSGREREENGGGHPPGAAAARWQRASAASIKRTRHRRVLPSSTQAAGVLAVAWVWAVRHAPLLYTLSLPCCALPLLSRDKTRQRVEMVLPPPDEGNFGAPQIVQPPPQPTPLTRAPSRRVVIFVCDFREAGAASRPRHISAPTTTDETKSRCMSCPFRTATRWRRLFWLRVSPQERWLIA